MASPHRATPRSLIIFDLERSPVPIGTWEGLAEQGCVLRVVLVTVGVSAWENTGGGEAGGRGSGSICHLKTVRRKSGAIVCG
jgi:hypothetical protein